MYSDLGLLDEGMQEGGKLSGISRVHRTLDWNALRVAQYNNTFNTFMSIYSIKSFFNFRLINI